MPAAWFLLALLTLSQAPDGSGPEADVSGVLETAAQCLERGESQRAYALLMALSKAPEAAAVAPSTHARMQALLGFAAEAAGDLETAASALEAVVTRTELADAILAREACLGWVRSALAMKDGARALQAVEKLPRDDQGSPQGLEMRAIALAFAGKTQLAEEALTAVLRRGDSPQAAFQLGVILFDRGDRAAALERFQQCLAKEPANHYAAIYRVRALLELERLEEADRALAPLLAPGGRATAEPQYLLGKLRLRQGDAAGAAASFRKALELQPQYGEALFGLGAALRKAGKEAEARDVLNRFAAVHREEAKRLRRADAVSQAALRATRHAGVLEEAARFFLESGDVESAETHAWRAVCLDPGRPAARLTLARALAAGGRYGAAAIQYRKLVEEEPGHAAARRELEELVAKHGRRER